MMGSLMNYQRTVFNFRSIVNGKPSVGSNPGVIITCGLRRSPRKSLWRSRVLSKEAIQVVHSLKLAKSTPKIQHLLQSRLSRLLKVDVLDVFSELHRQNELDLCFQVFDFVSKEAGYETELSLYSDMILLLGRNQLIGRAEELFSQAMENGLKPDTRMYTEMIGAYLQVGMTEKAMETYGLMKASGCAPDKLTFTILIRNLEKAGLQHLAATLKDECVDYVDSPDKFIHEL
ncbi:protein THYLAKOID ASSEMBLY 8-like, chloroplastic [Prosopis cineraria]|uniref:protein THYLAKOID ASSEMBLY 8-like, chloroplastic n=1 Tax=Prosopis cineraria TaxID=364024 RepID=UPI00240EBA51|nr:protein THYLAKOID ASSEMBLY 8-like, chloroplastic [Prosopis cineraria]XP_054813569.1 protein THYLAKOID ASSEMBLY 8-like, chloroplastic [Prosopis cineraria]